ncbi:arginine repressor [Arachnia propionica]|uniref:arginine repressor n=1 Tax=Arachnia propionica TaxID=1750 RepID=UPI0021AB5109|nr:arginine repressor [Arachnia propionica]
MPEVRRSARLALLRSLLEQGEYASQQELSEALAEQGVGVSQPTLSKDLLALGAVKRRASDGSLVYAVGTAGDDGGAALERLARLCSEVLQTIQSAANQVVVRTPPGAAQFLASHLDAARLPRVMGTIAGDDTVLVITTDDAAASRIAGMIAQMTRTGRPVPTSPEGEESD